MPCLGNPIGLKTEHIRVIVGRHSSLLHSRIGSPLLDLVRLFFLSVTVWIALSRIFSFLVTGISLVVVVDMSASDE